MLGLLFREGWGGITSSFPGLLEDGLRGRSVENRRLTGLGALIGAITEDSGGGSKTLEPKEM